MTMKLYGPDDAVLMEISSLEREGSTLVMRGKAFGTMPITAKLTPHEGRSALGLLDSRLVLFLLTFLFRR